MVGALAYNSEMRSELSDAVMIVQLDPCSSRLIVCLS